MGQDVILFCIMARNDIVCLGSVKRFGLITCHSLFRNGNPVLSTERVYERGMSDCMDAW